MNIEFSAVAVTIKISVDFSNINYREEMKYLQTFNLASGVETTVVTTVPTEPYSIEFIDPNSNTSGVITTGLGEPVLSASGSYYAVTVYSAVQVDNCKLKILY